MTLMLSQSSSVSSPVLSCPPRYGTPRRPERPTLGPRVAQIAQQLGKPLMPWQRYVIDVALEVDPATGLLVYRNVGLTVPRQSGKTTLLLATMVHRALGFGGRQGIVYTAQTRNAARKKWEEEHVRELESSSFKPMFRTKKSNGSEAILWRNGSFHGITSSTEKAGHGDTLDLAVLDEAFAHEDARLEQGLRPTMITRPQPQLWVVSTAGTARSVYLRKKVDAGRVRAELGLTDTGAYFEWSAPKGADPGDPATWWNCMPALGHVRPDGSGVTEAAIRSEFDDMDLAEFRRAYLNQWPDDTPAGWTVIPEAGWRNLADATSQAVGRVAFGVDATPDGTHAAIGVAGTRADGLGHSELIAHFEGTGWVLERAQRISERWDPLGWVIDPRGPAGFLIKQFEDAGLTVIKTSAGDVADATGSLIAATGTQEGNDPTMRYVPNPALDAAVAGAGTSPLGDGRKWNRRLPTTDISPLVAITLARHGLAAYVEEDTVEPFGMYV